MIRPGLPRPPGISAKINAGSRELIQLRPQKTYPLTEATRIMTYRFPIRIVCIVASILCCIALPRHVGAAPTKGWLGTNDNGNYYWTSNGRWADASRSFCGVYAFEEAPPGGVKFGPDGYPPPP